MIYNMKTIILSGLLLIMATAVPWCAQAAAGNGQQGHELQLSPEQLQELQQMEQAMNEVLAQMSPAEREEFEAASKALAQELEKLSPEEFQQFVNQQIFAEEGEPQPSVPTAAPAPQPQPAVVQEEPAPVQVIAPASKQDEAIASINVIIQHTQKFLQKLGTMPEFEGKYKKWTEQGKLKNWKKGQTWESLKKDIEKFVQLLYKLIEKNPQTQQAKYIGDYLKDENLLNSFNSLKSVLVTNQPSIEIEPFGIEEMNKESRALTRVILDKYLELFNKLSIFNALDTIFSKYEPIAKKAKESEEVAHKKAIEESKRTPVASPTIVAGSREQELYGGPSAASYSPSAYSPAYIPSYSPYGTPAAYGAPGDYSVPGGGSPMGRMPEKQDDQKELGADEGAERKEKPLADYKEEKIKENPALDRLVNKFETNFNDGIQALESTPLNPNSLRSYMTKPTRVAVETTSVVRKAKYNFEVSKNALKGLKDKLSKYSDSYKKHYKEQIKSIFDDHAQFLDKLSQEIGFLKENEQSVPQAKRQALLGMPKPQATPVVAKKMAEEVKGDVEKGATEKASAERKVEADQELPEFEEEIDSSVTLYDLKKEINDLVTAYTSL